MSKKTVLGICFCVILLTIGYISGMVSHNNSFAYNRPEYELINIEPVTLNLTGDPQRRAQQLIERIEKVEGTLDKMGAEGWELHSFWGNVAIFER